MFRLKLKTIKLIIRDTNNTANNPLIITMIGEITHINNQLISSKIKLLIFLLLLHQEIIKLLLMCNKVNLFSILNKFNLRQQLLILNIPNQLPTLKYKNQLKQPITHLITLL